MKKAIWKTVRKKYNYKKIFIIGKMEYLQKKSIEYKNLLSIINNYSYYNLCLDKMIKATTKDKPASKHTFYKNVLYINLQRYLKTFTNGKK